MFDYSRGSAIDVNADKVALIFGPSFTMVQCIC